MLACHHPVAHGIAGAGAMLALGAAGSLHCLGMCGPLSALLNTGRPGGAGRLALYHATRIAAYALVGAAAWGLGTPLRLTLPWPWLALLVSLPLLAYALFPALDAPAFLGRWHAKGFSRVAGAPAWLRISGLGLLTPLLPCGLLYAAVGAGLAAPSAWLAAAWLAAFAAGTLPLLALGQAGFAWALRTRPPSFVLNLRRFAAVFAAVTVFVLSFFG